ncbi:hypothetical protein C1645_881757 [Glomus cerebriforme]|uniref:Uncharacterized protein n=1 Tax=Glomus cerebriforme TaxID=658196 RepID=A0A397S430_9GLOM|nr:hypothetical protein C1645_881757 [Glomus cerebriforme]
MLTSIIEKDIMNLGFAHIKDFNHGCKSIIDVPLVIQAGFNYFENYSNDIWFQMMLQIKFNAAMLGLIWEKCVVNFLHKSLFESNKPLSENEMWKWQDGRKLGKFLPICYPPNTAGPDISIAFHFPDEGDDMPLDEEDDILLDEEDNMLLDEEERQEEMQEDMLLDEEEDDDKCKK